jgi:hypothetical protein
MARCRVSIGIRSVTRTRPDGVSWIVSRISVSPRYRRVVRCGISTGESFQQPLRASPSSDAKHASLSKCGQHSQSIDPSRATKAALRRSPIRA